MNQGLPKPLREALARQTPGEAHPSADALTAFAEHSLPQSESQLITAHLAQCADCREVVFVASNAAEEPVGERQELVAAAAQAQVPRPAFTGVFGAGQLTPSEVRPARPRRNRWRLWWVWTPAVVAAVLIVSGLFLRKRWEPGRPSSEMILASRAPLPPPAASQQPPAAAPSGNYEAQLSPAPVTKSPAGKTLARLPAATPARLQERSTPAPIERKIPEEPPTTTAAGLPAKPETAAQLNALLSAAKPAAPSTTIQKSFVEGESQSGAALFAQPQPAMRSVTNLRTNWRISSDGHVEHSTAPGVWTPVLADQPVTFHVVSMVGNNVWAGGSGGALFHSSDSGVTWSKQPLAGETGTIVSIHFSDAAHGIITTDGGARWSTSDGGVTWIKG